MKKLSKVLVLLVLAMGMGFAANAQSQKIAYVDSSVISESMPEAAKIQQDLQAYYAELQQEYQSMATELQNKYKDYQANEATMSPILRQSKEKELVDLQGRIQEFESNAESALAEKRVELMQPLLEKVQDAINKVGKEKGLTYVIDKALGVVVYIGDDAIDITPDVKNKLGL